MDGQQQLQQLVNDDIRSLSAYYQEMSAEQGSGVLVVNYYPSGEVAQMEAKFLKSSQISRLARQMGLPTLQVEFERHSPQSQMVVAVVTAETKGVVTVELYSKEAQTPEPETAEPESQASPAPKAKRKSLAKTTTKRKSPAKTTTQRQDEEPSAAQTPELESQASPEPIPETTSKPAAKRKSSSSTSTKRKSPTKTTTTRRKTTSQPRARRKKHSVE